MMAPAMLVLDVLLVSALLVTAIGALHSRDARHAVVLFIVVGLLLALAWARLRAPDVALAEAAIGAGLSGALLLATLRDEPETSLKPAANRTIRWTRIAVTALVSLLTGAMAWALWHGLAFGDEQRLAGLVSANLDASGVGNPVTAVLLNFRSYDTLLELAVLLTALLGMFSLDRARPPYQVAEPVLAGLTAWLVPLLILAGGYQLWVGAHAPGGAFQAGALLAAAGVVLYLAGYERAGLPNGLLLRALAVAGIGAFVIVGLGTLMLNGGFLAYPRQWAATLILVIESFATLAIAVTLVLAYLGGEPNQWRSTAFARTSE